MTEFDDYHGDFVEDGYEPVELMTKIFKEWTVVPKHHMVKLYTRLGRDRNSVISKGGGRRP